jgi:hypothetical protein
MTIILAVNVLKEGCSSSANAKSLISMSPCVNEILKSIQIIIYLYNLMVSCNKTLSDYKLCQVTERPVDHCFENYSPVVISEMI